MLDNVILLKLMSGEMVVAKLKERTAFEFVVEDPIIFGIKPPQTPNDKAGAYFMPYQEFSKDGEPINIMNSIVVDHYKPNEKIVDGYRRSTSPIEIPAGAGQIIKP